MGQHHHSHKHLSLPPTPFPPTLFSSPPFLSLLFPSLHVPIFSFFSSLPIPVSAPFLFLFFHIFSSSSSSCSSNSLPFLSLPSSTTIFQKMERNIFQNITLTPVSFIFSLSLSLSQLSYLHSSLFIMLSICESE